jgi:predicted Rossmann-fold nucleotide-binding protein
MPFKDNKKKIYRHLTIYDKINKSVFLQNSQAEIYLTQNQKSHRIEFCCSGLVVAFNGGGEIGESNHLFRQSGQVAKEIIMRGGLIMNGGRNSGIMEATSRAAGKFSVGINFKEQSGLGLTNNHGQTIFVGSHQTRLTLLTCAPPMVIIYPGSTGTLQELVSCLVAIKNNIKYGLPMPIVQIHHSWKKVLNCLVNTRVVSSDHLAPLKYFKSAKDILRTLPS